MAPEAAPLHGARAAGADGPIRGKLPGMMKLYDYWESGNGYKVRLLLAQLGIPHERIELDILRGETRSEEFLAKNPNGRIPLLELADGRRLAESGAIQFFLAEGTPFLPDDAFERALVLQWMFFEQYSHEPYIAVVRFWAFSGQLDEHADELPERRRRGYQALDVMERHLSTRSFFVGERYGIADISLYAYTHVAGEGGFELDGYPAIRAWLERVRGQAGHVPLEAARPA
jgi:glutathione S-transferase